MCDEECSALICGLDRGDCGYCSPGCYRYMLEDELCQEACYVLECDFDRGKCEDCAPLCFTDAIYVFAGNHMGNGSIASPYSLLSTAIDVSSSHHKAIYLLGSRITFSFPEAVHFPILITSLTCAERQSPFCSNEITSIDIVLAAPFTVSSAVTFQRVTFTTLSIFERLEVKGCPALVMQGGVWLDTDSNPASEDSVAAWNSCSHFKDIAVLVVDGGSLTLTVTSMQAVNVTNLLVQPKAFVQIIEGNVLLEEVHFDGVETLRGSGVGALILTENCEDCDIIYRGGSVQHLNSRFQYLAGAKASPFLYAESFHSLELAHVSFKFNTVIDAYSNVLSSSTRALLYLGNFLYVTVSDCEFHSNFVSGGLIAIDSSIQLSRDPDADNVASELLATHIDLRNLSFRWNLGEHCLISVSFTGDVLNIQLADAKFLDNAIEGENFLHFESQAVASEDLAFGAIEEVLLSNGTKVNVWIPPRTFILHGVAIRNSHAFSTLIFMHNFVNVNITDLEISDSGESDLDVLPLTFASCCSAAPVVPSFPSAPICFNLLWFDGCFIMRITSAEILRNKCLQSSALISSYSQGLLRVSSLTAAGNIGSFEFGQVLDIEGTEEFEGDHLSFQNNTNDSGPMMFFYAFTTVKLNHSIFEDNTGVYGGIFYFCFVQQVEFRNCTFRRSTAVDSIGGAVVWWTGNYVIVKVLIEDCTFESNTANHGGAIAFDNLNATTMRFQVRRSTFVGNHADFFGSAIYVTAPLVFTEESAIEDSTFRNNTAAYGSTAGPQFPSRLTLFQAPVKTGIIPPCARRSSRVAEAHQHTPPLPLSFPG